jgi:hypothetical protein
MVMDERTGYAANVQELTVRNQSFEMLAEKNGVLAPKEWNTFWWEKPAGDPPTLAGYSEDEKSDGERSVYIKSVNAGFAGWVSEGIALPSEMSSFKITSKVKSSLDYKGNKPRIFLTYYNNGSFLGQFTTDKTEGLIIEDWHEVSFIVDRSQFPAGTNRVVLNLTTTKVSSAANVSGTLYYDDVKIEASDESFAPIAFSLKGTKFANWWKMGEIVTFQLDKGAVPESVTNLIGSVYNSENEVVEQVIVPRHTFLDQGWIWTPGEPGYYEVAFAYQQSGSELTDLPVKYTYSQTDLKEFLRERYSIVVSPGPTKPISERWKTAGFSFQPNEGETSIKMADLIGFQFARIHALSWGPLFRDSSWAIEPSRGDYQWTKFDNQINLLEQYGFDMVGNLLFTPQWASLHPEETQTNISILQYSAYAPENMTDWENFVRAVVTRYGNQIKTWEIWNEPNIPKISAFWMDTPKRFVELLKTAYQTIKAEQTDSEVWVGGLAGRNYLSFYKEILNLGADSYYDKLAIHGYDADPREYERIDQIVGKPSKLWVNSESHALLVSSNSATIPSESELAKRMIIDFMKQIKWEAEKIAFFHMLNLSEAETLPYAKSKGQFTHAAGLFRSKPRIEPRLAASVMHNFLNLAGQSIQYKGEHALDNGQKAVVFDNDGEPLIALWTDEANEAAVDARLAAVFSTETIITDWEGKPLNVVNDFTIEPGKVYWISGADERAVQALPLSQPFLVSDFDRNVENQSVAEAKGYSGELFNPSTLEVAEGASWIADNWNFQSADQLIKPDDFEAAFAAGYSDAGLDLVIRVKDETFFQNNQPDSFWQGDSVQFAIDTFGQGFPSDQVEFQASKTSQGPVLYKHLAPYVGGDIPTNWTPRSSVVQYGFVKMDQSVSGETTYYIHVDSSELYPYVHDPKAPLRLSLLVNNNNGNGRIGWLEWSSGIGKEKKPSEYGKLWMLNGIEAVAQQISMTVGQTQSLRAKGLISNGSVDLLENVTWTTSNSSVATVTTNGDMRAINEGSAVIQVSYGPFTASILVTINKSPIEIGSGPVLTPVREVAAGSEDSKLPLDQISY